MRKCYDDDKKDHTEIINLKEDLDYDIDKRSDFVDQLHEIHQFEDDENGEDRLHLPYMMIVNQANVKAEYGDECIENYIDHIYISPRSSQVSLSRSI